ncbi:MAG TPA: hypothetical protein VG778_09640 [Blastocatellia bacterium]|jgi:hypothetical protein|nr:hypothetical protein [Blastocatellia bacterium]
MKLGEALTSKRLIIGGAIFVALIGVLALVALRRPSRVPMDRYVPASALAFLEMNNLPDVVQGLTGTTAWEELAPELGLSSQLRQIGLAADLVGRTGIGPQQAVIASRAQVAIAVTDLEAETGLDDGSTNLKPHFALLVETHSDAETTSRLLRDLGSVLAKRVYGENVSERSEDHNGVQLSIYQGPEPERQIVAASSGSVAVIANKPAAARICIDAIAGRTPTLADDAALKEMRPNVDQDSAVFAYVTEAGIGKLVKFGSALVSTRFTSDPERITSIASLFGHMSEQTTAGLYYSAAFVDDGVTERYLTALRPSVAEALSRALKPAPAADSEALALIPDSVEEFTIINAQAAGELPERILKELSPQLDLVAGLALREFVLGFRKQLGLEAGDSLGDLVGSGVVMAKFSGDEPTAMLLRVKDRDRVRPIVERYLTRAESTLTRAAHNGVEITTSSHPDRRAASFAGDYLILGTGDQIVKMLDAQAGGSNMNKTRSLAESLLKAPPSASIVSYKPETTDAAEMMLALSHLTRVTDGSPELLEPEPIKKAIGRLQPSVSFTEFRNYGVFTETRSAVGNFSLVGSVNRREEE